MYAGADPGFFQGGGLSDNSYIIYKTLYIHCNYSHYYYNQKVHVNTYCA